MNLYYNHLPRIFLWLIFESCRDVKLASHATRTSYFDFKKFCDFLKHDYKHSEHTQPKNQIFISIFLESDLERRF